MDVLNPLRSPLPFPLSGTFSANPVTMTAGRVAMELYDKETVKKLNALTAQARKQLVEAGQLAGIPLSITGDGSMFKLHFREVPPSNYRRAYEDDSMKKIVATFLDFMYDQGIIMVNSNSCMLSTVMTQKEIDLLAEAALKGFQAY